MLHALVSLSLALQVTQAGTTDFAAGWVVIPDSGHPATVARQLTAAPEPGAKLRVPPPQIALPIPAFAVEGTVRFASTVDTNALAAISPRFMLRTRAGMMMVTMKATLVVSTHGDTTDVSVLEPGASAGDSVVRARANTPAAMPTLGSVILMGAGPAQGSGPLVVHIGERARIIAGRAPAMLEAAR